MVKEVQLVDEYYEYDEDEDDKFTLFVPPVYYEYDERLCLIACLLLLEQRYRLLLSMTPQEIADEIKDIMDSLESELIATATTKVDDTVWGSFMNELIERNIPIYGVVSQDTSMYPIMESSLISAIEQLKYDLLAKSLFFKDNMSNSDFDITPNFKRAVREVTDAVGNNLLYTKEKSHRNVLKFVYGEDKLYNWYHMNDERVCDWCIYQGSLPPRRLDEIPLDHPWGRCTLDPVDSSYSDEYYLMLAGG